MPSPRMRSPRFIRHGLPILILGIKYVLPYKGLIFQKIRDLETGNPTDKYLFCVFSTFVCLAIMNFPYEVGWSAGGLETLDGPP